MAILFEYFGVPLQTPAEVRRKSKGGTNPMSPFQPFQPPLVSQPWMQGTEMAPAVTVKEGTRQACLEKLAGGDKSLENIWKVFRKTLCGRLMLTEDSKATKVARVMPSLPHPCGQLAKGSTSAPLCLAEMASSD